MRKSQKIPIFTASQFDDITSMNWEAPIDDFFDTFHIGRIETFRHNMTFPLAPHRRSVFAFVFVTKGTTIHRQGLSQYEITANHCFFIPAEEITSIEYHSADMEGFYCHFKLDIFNNPIFKIDLVAEFPFLQLANEPLVPVNNSEKAVRLLENLLDTYQKKQPERLDLIPLYLLTFFTELKHLQPHLEAPKNAAAHLTQLYKNAILDFIHERKSVIEFAEYLLVSPNHLHKCVKATTGKSAHVLLEDMRILEAKVLLKQTQISISEVAFKIAKFDQSDFSRFFKLKTGFTPFQYRSKG